MQVTAEAAPRSRSASVESVMHALMSVGRLIRQRSSGETLDTGTFWILKTIAANGSMRVTDLATCVNLDASTVSRHVAQLHQGGLIVRASDPLDRRAQRVRLSADGERQLNAALRARLALLERGLDSWAPEDLEQLDRLLTRFVSDIDRETKDSENR